MNDIARRGPWDIPLKDFNRQLKIVVLIHDLKTETIEREFELDYGNYEDRKFLGRLTFWCITNGRSIETIAPEEWEKQK